MATRAQLEAMANAPCAKSKHGQHGDPDNSGRCIYCRCTLEWFDDEDEPRIKAVSCPQCKRLFRLAWTERTHEPHTPITLRISDCPSGGIYDVVVACPWCDYEEPL